MKIIIALFVLLSLTLPAYSQERNTLAIEGGAAWDGAAVFASYGTNSINRSALFVGAYARSINKADAITPTYVLGFEQQYRVSGDFGIGFRLGYAETPLSSTIEGMYISPYVYWRAEGIQTWFAKFGVAALTESSTIAVNNGTVAISATVGVQL